MNSTKLTITEVNLSKREERLYQREVALRKLRVKALFGKTQNQNLNQ